MRTAAQHIRNVGIMDLESLRTVSSCFASVIGPFSCAFMLVLLTSVHGRLWFTHCIYHMHVYCTSLDPARPSVTQPSVVWFHVVSHPFLKSSWAWRRQSLLWKMCWCCFFVVTSVCYFLLKVYFVFPLAHYTDLLAVTAETHILLTAKVNGR